MECETVTCGSDFDDRGHVVACSLQGEPTDKRKGIGHWPLHVMVAFYPAVTGALEDSADRVARTTNVCNPKSSWMTDNCQDGTGETRA